MKNSSRLAIMLLASVITGCSGRQTPFLQGSAGPAPIYPDYKDVTIPVNIAPLNFRYVTDGAGRAVTTFSLGDRTVTIRGLEVKWGLRRWRSFIKDAAGGTIAVKAAVKTGSGTIEDSWTISVSADPVDPYLTYRLIEPAYQMWNEVSIRERCVEDFKETVICDHQHTENSCMNCHIHGNQRSDLSMFYIRGPRGGAILNKDGELRKLTLQTDGMISGTVYGDIHPSGRFGVFSTNIIIPGLHTMAGNRMEVYDTASDITVADFDRNEMINEPHVARTDVLETFPCFSADGESVFYCIADTVALPDDLENLRYSLVRAAFDTSSGRISESVDTVWSGYGHNASVCHPKASPDGRWVMFTVSSYGTFPINHADCELNMVDLETGEINTLEGVKGDKSDTYHCWSSNSRWFVFASKRGDGQYGKPYFCHIDDEGRPTKPFVLPQKSPCHYENTLKSYNVPDLGLGPVGIGVRDTRRMYKADSEPFKNNN